MHLQAWDPYYFSPFGVETKLRSYPMVGARISSPHFSPLFSLFCFKYIFRFFFLHLCLFQSYSFHFHRVSLAGPNFCRFLLFLFFSFSFTLRKIGFPQFTLVALFVESHIVLSFWNKDYVHFTQSDLKNHQHVQNRNTILQFQNMLNM